MLINIIHTALQSCENVRFHAGSTCPYCGGAISGYDERKKRFAILVEDNVQSPVHVIIQRSRCRSCGKISAPQEPFYPMTRIGSPVVDLCRTLSMAMPYSRASTYLWKMGVVVDRWSVRHYVLMPGRELPAVDLFGMKIPLSIISLSTLAGSLSDPGHLKMEDILEACNYPSMTLALPGSADEKNHL
jgi:hypothetical protein